MLRISCNRTPPQSRREFMDSLDLAADKKSIKAGLLFRWASCWVGAHWSKENKRLCVNVVPFVTFWLVWPGGNIPRY